MKTYDQGYEEDKSKVNRKKGDSARRQLFRYVASLSQEQVSRMIDTHTGEMLQRQVDVTGRALLQRSLQQEKMYVQAKLEISQPGDSSELQADKVADAVSRGDVNMSRMTMEQAGSEISMKGEGGTLTTTPEFDQQLEGTKGAGQGLDESTKSELEQHTGTDLSGVKVHTDSTASAMSEGINAKAFTHGQDIYFRDGNYSPGTPEGKSLLAHEVTHTVQQGGGVQKKVQRESKEDIYKHNSQQDPDFKYAGSMFLMAKSGKKEILSEELLELHQAYMRISKGGRKPEDYFTLIIAAQKALYPADKNQWTGKFSRDLLNSIGLFDADHWKEFAPDLLVEEFWIEDAVIYNWKNGFTKNDGIDHEMLLSILDISGDSELYRQCTLPRDTHYGYFHRDPETLVAFVKFVKSAQEKVNPGLSEKHTGKMDDETMYLFMAARGFFSGALLDDKTFQKKLPAWVMPAINFNTKNVVYSEDLLFNLFQFSGNRAQYLAAKEEAKTGEAFAHLVRSTQFILFPDMPDRHHGMMDEATWTMLNLALGIQEIQIAMTKTEVMYFDLVKEERTVFNSADRQAMLDDFSVRVYGKKYKELSVEEDRKLGIEVGQRFLSEEAFNEYYKQFDYTLDRWENFNNQLDQSFHVQTANILKGLAVGQHTVVRMGQVMVYNMYHLGPAEHLQKVPDKQKYKEVQEYRSRIDDLRRLQRQGYDMQNAIDKAILDYEKIWKKNKTVLGLESWEYELAQLQGKAGLSIYSLYQWGDQYQQWARESYPTNPNYKGEFFADILPGAIGSMLPMLIAEVISKIVGIPPGAVSALIGSVSGAGRGYDEAISFGASEEDAMSTAYLYGLIGLSEGLPIGRFMNRLTRIAPRLQGPLYKTIFTQYIVKGAKGGLEEGSQELFAGMLENLTAKEYFDYSRDIVNTRLWKEAGAGALIGLMLNGLGTARKGNTAPEAQQYYKEAETLLNSILMPQNALSGLYTQNLALEKVTGVEGEQYIQPSERSQLDQYKAAEALLEMMKDTQSRMESNKLAPNLSTGITSIYNSATSKVSFDGKADLDTKINDLEINLEKAKTNLYSQGLILDHMIELEGYNKQKSKEEYGSDGSYAQNMEMRKAWLDGWRPSDAAKEQNKGADSGTGGRSNKMHTDAKKGLDPTAESIRQGTVRMQDHPDYQANIDRATGLGYEVVIYDGYPHVEVIETITLDGSKVVTKTLYLQKDMMFIDLEHEMGHIDQLEANPDIQFTEKYKEYQTKKGDVKVQENTDASGKLLTWQNWVTEYQNRLVEVIRLYKRGVDSQILKDHIAGVDIVYAKYYEATNRGKSASKAQWVKSHFPELPALQAEFAKIKQETGN